MGGVVHHRTIGLFRAGYCTLLGGVMLFDLRDTVAYYRSPFAVWFPTPLMSDLGIGRPPLWVVVIVALATAAAFWSAAIGWFTRSSLALATLGFLAFHSVMLGFAKTSPLNDNTSHQTNLVPLVLLAMLVTPSIASWSVDRARSGRAEPTGDDAWVVAWPVRLFRFVLAAAYLGAGVSKLRESLAWADGETQQAQLLRASMRWDIGISETLAESELLGWVVGIGTIGFEIGFVVVAVLMPIRWRWRWLVVSIGIGFHVGTAVFLGIWHFLPYWAPAYLAFLTWEDIAARSGESLAPPAQPAEPPTTGHRLAVGSMVVLLLVPTAIAAEYWPISDFGAFSRRARIEASSVDRIVLVAEDGSQRFLAPGDLGEPFARRRSAARFSRWWFVETGGAESPASADVTLVEEVLVGYWQNLDDDLRADYPRIGYVRLSVDVDDGGTEVVERVIATVTPGR